MKKTFLSICILSVAVGANAQEAFKHLSAGLEVGTTGIGVELALPIVTDHLVLTAGYNFPSISIKRDFSFDTQNVKNLVGTVNNKLQTAGLPERITDKFAQSTTVNANAKLNFGAVKAMIEYYPWKKSSFHIVAGAYFGIGDFIGADGMTEKSFWSDLKAAQTEINTLYEKYKTNPQISGIDHDLMGKLKANVDGKTIQLNEKDGCGALNAKLAVAKVRPYVGIGVGRSIPNSHFSVQGDFGVWFHGTPSFQSDNTVAYDSSAKVIDIESALTTIKKVNMWPQLSIKLIYRIF